MLVRGCIWKEKLAAAIDEQKRVAMNTRQPSAGSRGMGEKTVCPAHRIPEGGYERCSGDLQLWAEPAAKEQSLKERENAEKPDQ